MSPNLKKLESDYGTNKVKETLNSLREHGYLAHAVSENAIHGTIISYYDLSQKGIDLLSK